jgi:1,2-diacylglycerol 3-beta-galactosyltransferase
MGPIKKTAEVIAGLGLPMALVVVTGRNHSLKASLERTRWPMPTFVYGFVREMPDFMRAADILITKAGPGTITEGFNAGLPMILYSRLPGQEDGNVAHVVAEGAGVWAPSPELVAGALSNWLRFPEKRLKAAGASARLAYPQAAHTIAGILAEHSNVKLVL